MRLPCAPLFIVTRLDTDLRTYWPIWTECQPGLKEVVPFPQSLSFCLLTAFRGPSWESVDLKESHSLIHCPVTLHVLHTCCPQNCLLLPVQAESFPAWALGLLSQNTLLSQLSSYCNNHLNQVSYLSPDFLTHFRFLVFKMELILDLTS